MPAKSKAQYRYMQAMLDEDAKPRKGKSRPSKATAREFVKKTPSPKSLPERKRKS